MRCDNCHSLTSRIKVIGGQEYCTNCYPMSESGGTKIDGLITRNSFRIRTEQENHKADFIQPHAYDKNTRSLEPSADFIKRYPQHAHNYFTAQELKQAGYPKLAKMKPKKPEPKVHFRGSAKKAMERLLK